MLACRRGYRVDTEEMENKMARYIDLSDAAKGKVQRRALAKVDWTAVMADIAKQAEAVKASDDKESRKARRLAQLRNDYSSALHNRYFVETGRNAHA